MTKKSLSHGQDEYRKLVNRKLEQRQRSRIPTEEDFARAKAHMAAQNRIFRIVRAHVFRTFGGHVPLHEIYLFPGPTTDYDAYVFYETKSDVETYHDGDVEHAIKDAISDAFAASSENGMRPTVSCKFDSHENVMKQCNGNYRKYLG